MAQPLSSSETPREFMLGRARMLAFLDELESAPSSSRTLYIPAKSAGGTELQGFFGQAVPPRMERLVADSATGAAVFWGSRKLLVLPPFPLARGLVADGYYIEPLRNLLARDHTIALFLVRLGSYAIGISRGEELISAKAGTGLVHARHRQGGSSQHRFERHREKQIEQFLIRVCSHLHEEVEPHIRNINYVVYGGARTTILLLRKRCPFLERFEGCALPPVLDIPDPRRATLETVLQRAWSSRLYEWLD